MIRRTKIVATIGPASWSPEILRELFRAGLNVARITLAHGTLDQQRALIATIREEADRMHASVGILVDLPGPKVRTTALASPADLTQNDVITLVSGETEPSTASRLTGPSPGLAAITASRNA